jgi:septal ring factor EnvC (AmiA/AmiB activator)
MDWSSILIGLGSASGALGLSEVIRIFANKWANKKKDIVDLEAKDIFNREKMFSTLSEINDKLADEVSDLTQKLIAVHSKMAEVINDGITLTMKNGELKAQNELLRMENEQMKKTLGELKEKLSKMEAKIKELEKKI